MKRVSNVGHPALHVSRSVHRSSSSSSPSILLDKIQLQSPRSSLLLLLLLQHLGTSHNISEQVLSLGRIYRTTSMASLLIAKGAVCSFSRSLKLLPPLTSRPSGRRATRLYTTSSSISSDHADYDGVEGEASLRAKATAREGAEKAKEKAAAAKDWTAEAAESAKEKTREGVRRAAEKAGEVKERTAETASKVTEKSKEAAETTKEAVQNLGEKAKQTVEGAWGAAKETTKKIKETVVGKDSTSELESEAEELEAARRRAAGGGKGE